MTEGRRRSRNSAWSHISGLDYAQGSYETDFGVLSVDWHREAKTVILRVTLTGSVRAVYRNEILEMGTHTFQIQEDEGK